MSVLRALASLRWGYGAGILVSWVALFLVVATLQRACPPGDKYCHPLFKPVVCSTFTLYALFFLAMVWSETVRRVVIAPKRRDDFDQHAFYAVGLSFVVFAAIVFFFT